jgi:hypothetical protein
MTMFKPAQRNNVPLLIALEGASGSGKTLSAHLLAAGIAEEMGRAKGREGRVFGIDTERCRMLHYAGDFPFMHAELSPPFRPTRYGELITGAEREGADVIIIDSFSHEHEGEGGLLEWADELEARGQKPPKNWMEPKRDHKRLVNQMLASSAHIIVCLRSEEKMKITAVPQFNADGSPKMWNGKQSTKMVITPPTDLSVLERWVPICEKRFPYEITTSLLLTPQQPGIPIYRKVQAQHRQFISENTPLTKEVGAALARWSMGGAASPTPPSASGEAALSYDLALAELEQAATKGTDELRRVWSLRAMQPHRDALSPEMNRLKEKAALADPKPPEAPSASHNEADGQI